jgi:hypothetical protein
MLDKSKHDEKLMEQICKNKNTTINWVGFNLNVLDSNCFIEGKPLNLL